MLVRPLTEVRRNGATTHPLAHEHHILRRIDGIGHPDERNDVRMAEARPYDDLAEIHLMIMSIYIRQGGR
jgi:hypothetical protein